MQRAHRIPRRCHIHQQPRTWVRSLLLFLAPLLLTAQVVGAQPFEVEGTVYSATEGIPLPGVNIVETNTQNGTTTNVDGEFTIRVAGPDASLTVSFVGYQTQVVPIEGRSSITVELQPSLEFLEEVVVTAFGIEREQRALGYSVGTVQGERLAELRETNLANALSGKVAGVVVSNPATGPAGSSRVVIRGNAALEGNNQPLYVVDGVPIDNSNLGSAGMWGGTDAGDGIQSISPDDIESMTVLKGPAAAALYGTRAQNGVIVITTKRGGTRPGGGVGVEFNSNTTFETPLVDYTDYQTTYGQGVLGRAPQSQAEALNFGTSSWGARLDGRDVVQFDGVARPYSLVSDRLSAFYETGLTSTNTIALTGGFNETTFRFSGSYLTNDGIVPNSGMDRYNLSLRGSSQFGRLSADVRANYVREDVTNRPRLSDAPGNANYSISILPPNINPEVLAPGNLPDDELAEMPYTESIFLTNPFWAAERFVNDDQRDRLMGYVLLRYDLTDWLNIQGRTGQDWYTTRGTSITPFGTRYAPLGSISEFENRIMERNSDFMVTATRRVTPDVSLMANFGGNRLYRRSESLSLNGSEFNIPDLQTISNTRNQTLGYGFQEHAINSLFGMTEFGFRDYLYLTLTGRNDWSSTLPPASNSFFYPSVALSFVASDAFTMPEIFSFARLRASWAEVGGDTSPYRLGLTYRLLSVTHGGIPLGTVAQTAIPLAGLQPQSSVGTEAGVDVRFFDNRFGIDFTYYDQSTTNQILATTVPSSSGFSSKIINAGEMTNEGIELLLTSTPVRTSDFSWEFDVNYARNNNEVVELFGEVERLELAQSRSQTAWIVAEVGEPYGAIRGWAYERDDQGRIVVGDDGLPVRGELMILGNGTPDWTAGIMNTLRYRNLMLSALIDVNWGGDIFSGTNAVAYSAGLHQNTLAGREECEAAGWPEDGCWVPPNTVRADGSENTIEVLPSAYFGRIGGQIAEEFIYDASYVKLRELQLSYRLPQSWLRNSPIRLATASIVARNLALLYSDVPNVDPESNYSNTNAQGLELAGVPQTRSIGVNLSFRL